MNRELVKESISQFEVAIDNLKQSLLEDDKEIEVGEVVVISYSDDFCVKKLTQDDLLVPEVKVRKITQQEVIDLLFK